MKKKLSLRWPWFEIRNEISLHQTFFSLSLTLFSALLLCRFISFSSVCCYYRFLVYYYYDFIKFVFLFSSFFIFVAHWMQSVNDYEIFFLSFYYKRASLTFIATSTSREKKSRNAIHGLTDFLLDVVIQSEFRWENFYFHVL